MGEYVVPDYVGEPIVGWRCWFVVPRHKTSGPLRLRSFVYSALWEPQEEFTAACRNHCLLTRDQHDAPDEDCNCGVYAHESREHVEHEYLSNSYWTTDKSEVHRVIGQVALWGKIIPGEKGWRAQYAYPLSLEVPTEIRYTSMPKIRTLSLTAKEVAYSLRHYKVPTEVTTLRVRVR